MSSFAKCVMVVVGVAWPTCGLAQDAPPSPEPAGGSRMEFDERLVRGSVASGSVFLFSRVPRALPGLVPMRRSYRDAIIEPLLADRLSAKPEGGPAPSAPSAPSASPTPTIAPSADDR